MPGALSVEMLPLYIVGIDSVEDNPEVISEKDVRNKLVDLKMRVLS